MYQDATAVPVVPDNFEVHDSLAARAAVATLDGGIVLHLLPPYCPNNNKIERVWLDLHAKVTRNHRSQSMDELMQGVTRYL